MGYSVNVLDDYIEVRLEGAFNKEVAMMASSMLMELEEYKSMHTLWDFTGAYMDLAVAEYKEMIDYFSEIMPKNQVKNRTGLLVSSDFEESMSNLFVNRASGLPVSYRIFQSREEAETWVSEKEPEKI